MENAWLDSLSEDWISQPRSAGSPAGSLPSLPNSTTASESCDARGTTSSRILFYNPRRQSNSKNNDSSNLPLSERSINDNNIPLSQHALRRPSKLGKEISNGTRGRQLSRTVSASTTESIQHHTVQHKSLSASPQKLKGQQQTPEWRRRLLHGEVAYGEQRDLFSPAGLETIFQPPPSQDPSSFKLAEHFQADDMTMPSSPPPYSLGRQSQSTQLFTAGTGKEDMNPTRREPQAMKYKMVDRGSEEFSEGDLSRSSSFHPAPSASQKAPKDLQSDGIAESTRRDQDISSKLREQAEGDRVVSGQSDVRHEELSPIFISRHNRVDGRIDYSPLDLPNDDDEQQQGLRGLSIKNQFGSSKFHKDSSQVPPENATITTDDFAHNGKFVNLGRGGQSEEGSFHQRMLSPSSLPPIDESAMLLEESIEASTPKELRYIENKHASDEFRRLSGESVSQQVAHALHPNLTTDETSRARPVSGSPLKLFGAYDTFTNQRLLRRLSQFENSLSNDEIHKGLDSGKSGESGIESTNNTEMNEAYIAPSSPSRPLSGHETMSGTVYPGNINRFGDGDLDRFEFSEESLESSNVNFEASKENATLSLQDGSSQKGFSFHLQPSPALEGGALTQRRTIQRRTRTMEHVVSRVTSARRASTGSDISFLLPVSQHVEALDTPRKRTGNGDGKRLLRSPPKNPTPKRRRTLHKADISHDALDGRITDLVKEGHEQIQSVVGKKRKDARHGDHLEPANPQVMAMRQILRPRTPTPSQRSSQDHKRAPLSDIPGVISQRTKLEQQEKIARVQAELDSTAPSKTSMASAVGQPMHDNNRKGSVTTQDFLDEAKKIMAGIRGKARPSIGLNSVEESESENDKQASIYHEPGQDESYQESTREPFSRPPSRDGGPLPRLPQKQADPEVLSHLRKYEEMSDMDSIIASSLKCIGLAKDAVNMAKRIDQLAGETVRGASSRNLSLDKAYQSDPPNIQVTEYPELQRKRKHSSSSVPTGVDDFHEVEFPSHGSNASGPSTGRSIPTGSSRGSDSKHVIAPHAVSHLIPEQLAGMVFDREKRIWVKRNAINGDKTGRNILPSEDTEDDPFGDIPDLTVDETQELHRVQAVAAKQREEARVCEVQRYQKHQDNVEQFGSDNNSISRNIPNASNTDSASSELSNINRLPSSTAAQDTRLTPWTDDQELIAKGPPDMHQAQVSVTQNIVKEVTEEVEEEISIHEGRAELGTGNIRRRNVTICFSSPLASIIPPRSHGEDIGGDAVENLVDDSIIINQSTSQRRSYPVKTRSSYSTASRRLSLSGQSFLTRPVSRIDEREEESYLESIHDDRLRRSVSVVISTPLPVRTSADHASMVPSSVARHSNGLLQLTPLADFTMNQADESFALEASYNGQLLHHTSSGPHPKSLSLSVKELVQGITDIEPYEPFWEHIKRLQLRGKKLQNLHMLSRFCSQLEELDVSDNSIGQLDGTPDTIRSLRIAHNCLSDLSSWGQLRNLQYVDVSNNDLSSLEGFKDLVHLRALRADNNKVKSLKGVIDLDGLVSLRLRGNVVQSVDFAGTSLQRLTELDLKGNYIRDARNLQELGSLTTLNLEDNHLESFAGEDRGVVWALKYLKLGGNKLEHLDISRYPNLRLLYLDRNRLGRVTGLLKAKHLDSLSLREQQDGSAIDHDAAFLDEAFEARKLFLSGNLLSSFTPSIDFLNLQYLELANCGLGMLPVEFGQMMSNVRILNLNFNALRDIKPLLGIIRLKKLHLAGNRIARLRKTTNILAQFSSLTKVDLRNNPLTLGFYPPASEKRLVVHDSANDERDALLTDPFTLQDGDREKDTAYAGRLDMETKMRRRVFEMLMLGGCARLQMLDGLLVDRASLDIRDKVWEELVKAGVVYGNVAEIVAADAPATEPTAQMPEMRTESRGEGEVKNCDGDKAECHPEAPLEELWPAEDSFA